MDTIVHADRVSETSTTTGTGTLTLSGLASKAGMRTFAAAGITSAWVHYCISDDAGNWEVGRGLIGDVGTTLSRSASHSEVFASSNAGALVDFPAGDKSVELVLPANLLTKQIHYSLSQPTVNDDRDDGFFDGSIWIVEDPPGDGVTDTFTQMFYMDSSWPTAADWKPIGLVIGRGTTSTDRCLTVPDWVTNFRWDFTGLNSFNLGGWNSSRATHCAAFGEAANLQNRDSIAIGAGRTTGQTVDGGHQAEIIAQKGQTTDATPTKLGNVLDPCFEQHENGAATYLIQIVGYEPATGDCFSQEIRALVSRATGTCTIVAQATTAVGASAGAAAWTATLGTTAYPGTGAEGPSVTVTGEAAHTIEWTATAWRTSAHKAA